MKVACNGNWTGRRSSAGVALRVVQQTMEARTIIQTKVKIVSRNTKMSFLCLCISTFIGAFSIATAVATAQPSDLQSCNGVHKFYSNPLATSGRGSDLRILFFIGERENILRCFKNTRAVKVEPLHKELASKTYSKIDEKLILSIAQKLNIKDPYLANGGI
tara:strand:- start:81 stop:563 length:483 start_codon:yes stop_codon:yes gene_type:complete